MRLRKKSIGAAMIALAMTVGATVTPARSSPLGSAGSSSPAVGFVEALDSMLLSAITGVTVPFPIITFYCPYSTSDVHTASYNICLDPGPVKPKE